MKKTYLLLLINLIIAYNSLSQSIDTCSHVKADSIYVSNHLISKSEFDCLINKFQKKIDTQISDSLSLFSKVIIIKLINTISFQENLYKIFIYSHFRKTVRQEILFQILDDLEFIRKGHIYYSEKYGLYYEGKDEKSSFKIFD